MWASQRHRYELRFIWRVYLCINHECVLCERTKDVRNRNRICEREEDKEKSVRLKLISATPSPLCLSILHRLHNLHLTAVYSDCWKVLYTNQRSDLSELRAHGMQLRSQFDLFLMLLLKKQLRCWVMMLFSVCCLWCFSSGLLKVCLRSSGGLECLECSQNGSWNLQTPSEPSTQFHCFTHIYNNN